MPENDICVDVHDNVNHPQHYQSHNGIECIDAIMAAVDQLEGREAFLVGTVIKYLWRYRKKEKPLEDLEKAKWYLEKLITLLKMKEEDIDY